MNEFRVAPSIARGGVASAWEVSAVDGAAPSSLQTETLTCNVDVFSGNLTSKQKFLSDPPTALTITLTLSLTV